MTWKPRKRKWNWRAFLTAEELRIIRAGDALLDEIERLRKSVNRQERAAIMNRAIQRAKLAPPAGRRRE